MKANNPFTDLKFPEEFNPLTLVAFVKILKPDSVFKGIDFIMASQFGRIDYKDSTYEMVMSINNMTPLFMISGP